MSIATELEKAMGQVENEGLWLSYKFPGHVAGHSFFREGCFPSSLIASFR